MGNKKDLVGERKVSYEEGSLKASDSKCLYFECSALSGEGFDELFEILVDEYFKTIINKW